MRQIGTCTEDEMIWEYLRAEYTSERFSEKLKGVMEEMSLDKQIILAPEFFFGIEVIVGKCREEELKRWM